MPQTTSFSCFLAFVYWESCIWNCVFVSLIVFVDEGGTSWASVRHSPRHCLLRPGQKTWQMLGRTLGAETYIKCKNEDNALQCVECCPRLQQTQLTQAGQGTKGPNGHLGIGLSW